MANTTSDNTIIVPINVQAFCIGEQDEGQSSFIKPNADFSLMPYRKGNQTYNAYAYVSDHVLNSPFSSDRHAMRKGVHLHWALPDAFTHAEVKEEILLADVINAFEEDGQKIWDALVAKKWLVETSKSRAKFNDLSLLHIQNQTLDGKLKARQSEIQLFLNQYQLNFPSVPNRWLVTRICTQQGTVQSSRSWVIESDFLSDGTPHLPSNPLTTTVPFESDKSSKPYRYMGKKFELASWTPDQAPEYYPHLTAVGYGDIEFAGYYPNCSSVFGFHDDLQDIASDAQYVSYQVSGWFSDKKYDPAQGPFQKGEKDAQELLNQLNWTVSNEGSPINNSVYAGMVNNAFWHPEAKYLDAKAPKVDVAFGANEKEALSALGTSGERQWLLNAWQMGLETKLDKPGGLFEIEDSQHRHRFIKKNEGHLWNLQDASQAIDLVAPTDEKEIPATISAQLSIVNEHQETFNNTSTELLTLRQRVFADWYQYMSKKYDQALFEGMDLGQFFEGKTSPPTLSEIRQYIEKSSEKIQEVVQELESIATTLNKALQQLEALLKDTSYKIGRAAAPVHYQGNDPVVLMRPQKGEAQWHYAGNRNGSEKVLQCRLSSEILVDTAITPVAPLDQKSGLLPFPDILTKLVNEAAIFSFYNTYEAVVNAIKEGTVVGVEPVQLAVNEWSENPWLIMQLQWKMDYRGLKTEQEGQYEPSYITDNFQFSADHSELELREASHLKAKFPHSQIIKGKCLLTPNVKENVKEQLSRSLELYGKDERTAEKLGSIKEQVTEGAMLAQTLSGFNDALVMSKEVMQLKVNDPLRAVFEESFNTMVQDAVSGENLVAPLPYNQYQPIRAGLVKVDKLRMVDLFGYCQEIDVSHVHYADQMKLKTSIGHYNALLPPRITQSSRLTFDFLGANASDKKPELTEYAEETPVFGWVLLNLLESNFMVYDWDGVALGSLRTAPNDADVILQPAPGENVRPLKDANSYIQNFVASMRQKGASFLQAFLKTLEGAKSYQDLQAYRQDVGIAPLIGEPIALVRATLRLQLQGLPANNKSWKALENDIQQQKIVQRTTNDFTNVAFPVQLGNRTNLKDGLYGFFNGDKDFNTFYAEKAAATQEGIQDTTEITLTPDGTSKIITMLVQPSNPVHAHSGIVPDQKIELSFEKCVKVMNQISANFLASPLLINSDNLSVPLSKDQGWEWSFVSQKSGEWNQTKDDILDASNEATYITSKREIFEGWLQLSKEEKGTNHH